jgi:hypothetical protein
MTAACGNVFGVRVAVAVLCMLVSMASFGDASLIAEGGCEAIHSMAEILLNFTHVPSVQQTATLQGILDNHTTTVAERVVAEALMNVEHVVSPDDKPRLEALIGDESAPGPVKTLAAILNSLTHTPTEADKETLTGLLRQNGVPVAAGLPRRRHRRLLVPLAAVGLAMIVAGVRSVPSRRRSAGE